MGAEWLGGVSEGSVGVEWDFPKNTGWGFTTKALPGF
jgi:hypothetical protein